jgi:hypothetical protein
MTIHNTCVTKCMYASNRKYRDPCKKSLKKIVDSQYERHIVALEREKVSAPQMVYFIIANFVLPNRTKNILFFVFN